MCIIAHLDSTWKWVHSNLLLISLKDASLNYVTCFGSRLIGFSKMITAISLLKRLSLNWGWTIKPSTMKSVCVIRSICGLYPLPSYSAIRIFNALKKKPCYIVNFNFITKLWKYNDVSSSCLNMFLTKFLIVTNHWCNSNKETRLEILSRPKAPKIL